MAFVLYCCSSSPYPRLVANDVMLLDDYYPACDAEHFLFPFSSLIINNNKIFSLFFFLPAIGWRLDMPKDSFTRYRCR